MKITNEFTVHTSIEHAWQVLTDLEGIAPCMPGARLTGVEGDTYQGKVKVKVGPITVAYNGTAKIADRNLAEHSATLEAEGRETTGPGSARAKAFMSVTADPAGSLVRIVTDYSVAGRVAQFGRGVMEDVSRRIVNEMAACIKANVEAAEPSSGASAVPEGPGASPSASAASPGPAPMVTAKPVNAFGLLFSVMWARLRSVFSRSA